MTRPGNPQKRMMAYIPFVLLPAGALSHYATLTPTLSHHMTLSLAAYSPVLTPRSLTAYPPVTLLAGCALTGCTFSIRRSTTDCAAPHDIWSRSLLSHQPCYLPTHADRAHTAATTPSTATAPRHRSLSPMLQYFHSAFSMPTHSSVL